MKDKRWRATKIITPEAQAVTAAMVKKATEEAEKARLEAIEASRLIEEKALFVAKQKAEEEERRQFELAWVIKKNQECVEKEMRRIELKRAIDAAIARRAIQAAQRQTLMTKVKELNEARRKKVEEDKAFVLNHPVIRTLSPKAKMLVLEGNWVPMTQRLVLEGNVDAFRHHWETLARGKTVRFE